MEMKGKIINYSGFTPTNKNHVLVEVLGMENYFGNVIKIGDEVILEHPQPEPIVSEKADGKCNCISRQFCLELCDSKSAEDIWESVGSTGQYWEALRRNQSNENLRPSGAPAVQAGSAN